MPARSPDAGRRRFLAGLAAAGAAGLAGCTGGGANFSPGRNGDTEWPLPGRGPAATNYAPDAVAPRTPPTERWRVETGRAVGRLVVADGIVYLPAEDGLWALGLRDGDERWRASVSPYGVSVADGRAYVTARDEPTVYALDAATGEELWRAKAAADFGVAPVPAPNGDAVYVGDTAGRVAALAPESGETRWRFEAFTGVYSLAAREDRVYVGTTGGETYELHVVERETGVEGVPLWRTKLPGTVRGLSVTADGVYAGTFGGGFHRLAPGPSAGRVVWRAPSAPTVTDALVRAGPLVVGAGTSGTAAFGAAGGDERWRVPNDVPAPASPPVAAGDTLYVGVGGALLAYALGGGTGVGPYRFDVERWRRRIPVRALAVARGTLVVASDDLDGSAGVVVLE